jgi:flavin-dependent dehydrogenase
MIEPRPNQPERYDAIVVGARVAGASTAMLMARRGLRVLMVDRRRPGSDTLSTHALMRGGVLQLQRWGLLERVKETGAQPVRKTTFHYGDTVETIDLKPSAGVEALYAPRRNALDSILVEAAADAGVEVRFGVTVQDLITDPAGRVVGIAARTNSGTRLSATAPITIGADGMRSVVAQQAGAAFEHQGTGASAIIYSYWSGKISEGYEWFYRPGVSSGLIPTNGGETCVWIGAPTERFMSELRTDLEESFHRVLAEAAPEAVVRLESGGCRESRFHGFPGVPGFMRQPHGAGWALVGDSSHFKDPLSAHGITDALRDAEFLAEAVASAGRGLSEREALVTYGQVRDRLSMRLHEATDALATYQWDLSEVRELLLAMSKSMKEEVEALLSIDQQDANQQSARAAA